METLPRQPCYHCWFITWDVSATQTSQVLLRVPVTGSTLQNFLPSLCANWCTLIIHVSYFLLLPLFIFQASSAKSAFYQVYRTYTWDITQRLFLLYKFQIWIKIKYVMPWYFSHPTLLSKLHTKQLEMKDSFTSAWGKELSTAEWTDSGYLTRFNLICQTNSMHIRWISLATYLHMHVSWIIKTWSFFFCGWLIGQVLI